MTDLYNDDIGELWPNPELGPFIALTIGVEAVIAACFIGAGYALWRITHRHE